MVSRSNRAEARRHCGFEEGLIYSTTSKLTMQMRCREGNSSDAFRERLKQFRNGKQMRTRVS